jgi:hypothetical protein
MTVGAAVLSEAKLDLSMFEVLLSALDEDSSGSGQRAPERVGDWMGLTGCCSYLMSLVPGT